MAVIQLNESETTTMRILQELNDDLVGFRAFLEDTGDQNQQHPIPVQGADDRDQLVPDVAVARVQTWTVKDVKDVRALLVSLRGVLTKAADDDAIKRSRRDPRTLRRQAKIIDNNNPR